MCETAISYCVLVLEEPVSLDPAEKEFAVKSNETNKEIIKFFVIL